MNSDLDRIAHLVRSVKLSRSVFLPEASAGGRAAFDFFLPAFSLLTCEVYLFSDLYKKCHFRRHADILTTFPPPSEPSFKAPKFLRRHYALFSIKTLPFGSDRSRKTSLRDSFELALGTEEEWTFLPFGNWTRLPRINRRLVPLPSSLLVREVSLLLNSDVTR